MNPKAIVGGAVAALIGALAWGVGLGVGLWMREAGGGGQQDAILACVLTVASIFAGKAIGFGWSIPRELEAMTEELLPREVYDDVRTDAVDWVSVDQGDPHA